MKIAAMLTKMSSGACLLLCAGCAAGMQPSATKANATLDALSDALDACDMQSFQSLHITDGASYDLDQYDELEKHSDFDFEGIEMRCAEGYSQSFVLTDRWHFTTSDAVISAGKMRFTVTDADGEIAHDGHGRFTIMLVESDGQLKVAHAHLTRLGAGEAPAEDE